jgi:gas vesicle protein
VDAILSWEGIWVILIGGVLGGIANSLIAPTTGQKLAERLARNIVLGVTASVIAFGVSGTATGTVWQQLSTCTVAGVGGGQVVRSYARSKELQRSKRKMAENVEITKELVELV